MDMWKSGVKKLRQRLGMPLSEESSPVRPAAPPWPPPGHFYSPLVNPQDVHVRAVLDSIGTSELPERPDVAINDSVLLQYLDAIVGFYPEFSFPEDGRPEWRYYSNNDLFGVGDAAVYFGMMRQLKPKRIIEVGSGFSSCLAMDTNDKFLGGRTEITCIEPYPEQLIKLLPEKDTYLKSLRREKVQDVPTEVFQALEPNDILFIDSSHVCKTGSDVNDYMFRILPNLAAGVFIQIHDIFYPFEYPGAWIDHENRSWNEAYLLRSFLQYNPAFRIVYWNHYTFRHFQNLVLEKIPAAGVNCGGSIWLEKVA